MAIHTDEMLYTWLYNQFILGRDVVGKLIALPVCKRGYDSLCSLYRTSQLSHNAGLMSVSTIDNESGGMGIMVRDHKGEASAMRLTYYVEHVQIFLWDSGSAYTLSETDALINLNEDLDSLDKLYLILGKPKSFTVYVSDGVLADVVDAGTLPPYITVLPFPAENVLTLADFTTTYDALELAHGDIKNILVVGSQGDSGFFEDHFAEGTSANVDHQQNLLTEYVAGLKDLEIESSGYELGPSELQFVGFNFVTDRWLKDILFYLAIYSTNRLSRDYIIDGDLS